MVGFNRLTQERSGSTGWTVWRSRGDPDDLFSPTQPRPFRAARSDDVKHVR